MMSIGRLRRPAAFALLAWSLAGPALAKDRVTRVAGDTAAAAETTSAPTPTSSADISRMAPGDTTGALSVTVDQARIVRLPDRSQTVVVGNPAIADFSIQKNGIVVVTGKSFGVTNIIALDSAGNVLAESTVSVNAPTNGIMVVQRGFDRQSYACTPVCQPSVVLGDANAYFNENRVQADAHNQFATSR